MTLVDLDFSDIERTLVARGHAEAPSRSDRRRAKDIRFAEAYGMRRYMIRKTFGLRPVTKRQRRLCQRTGHIGRGFYCRRCDAQLEVIPSGDYRREGTITGRIPSQPEQQRI